MYEKSVRASPFKLIPKIHKNPVASRLIVMSQIYFTPPGSTFVDKFIKPLVYKEKTVLKDAAELIKILETP